MTNCWLYSVIPFQSLAKYILIIDYPPTTYRMQRVGSLYTKDRVTQVINKPFNTSLLTVIHHELSPFRIEIYI